MIEPGKAQSIDNYYYSSRGKNNIGNNLNGNNISSSNSSNSSNSNNGNNISNGSNSSNSINSNTNSKDDRNNGKDYKSLLLERYYDPKHKGWCIPGWIFLHSIADSFPENPSADDRKWAELLFGQCLPHLLPCAICANHMAEDVSKNPPDTSSGQNLSTWLYEFHNRVRERSGEKPLDLEDCRKDQEWYRVVNWAKVISDLKQSCNEATLGKDYDNSNFSPKKFTDVIKNNLEANNSIYVGAGNNYNSVTSSCTIPEKDHSFRRNNFLNIMDKIVKDKNVEQQKSKLRMIGIIMLVIVFLAIASIILGSSKYYKYDRLLKEQERVNSITIKSTLPNLGPKFITQY